MSRGRYRQGRYQQGIGIPETLGVQPTTWTEPTGPEMRRATWTSPNTGASRNYGSTPNYVDTMPHRWTYGDESKRGFKFFPKRKKDGDEGSIGWSRTSVTTTTTRTGGGVSLSGFPAPSGPPATGTGVPSTPPAYPAPTGTGVAVPPPPRSSRRASSMDDPFATPPVMASGGAPTPPPPRRVRRMEPLEMPPMSEGGDLFTMTARTASDEPFSSSVEWRDEPENPFPMGPRETFDARRMFDPEYLPTRERSTSPANSRAKNRRPKRT